MLALLENTFLDTRTPLEKSLDKLIDKRKAIKKQQELENINEASRKKIVFGMACGMMLQTTNNVSTVNFDKIDVIGRTLLGGVKTLGYWVCLIMSLVEIIKIISRGGEKGEITKVLVKSTIAMIGLYGIQWYFDLIVSIFNN
jgi:hypothetical protein